MAIRFLVTLTPFERDMIGFTAKREGMTIQKWVHKTLMDECKRVDLSREDGVLVDIVDGEIIIKEEVPDAPRLIEGE